MIRCSCCLEYAVEEILRDDGRGAGIRRIYVLKHHVPNVGTYTITETASLDELAAVLDERGILMWPADEDGCE